MEVVYLRTSNIYDDSRATKEIMALAEQGYKVHVLGWNRDGTAVKCSNEVFSKYSELVSFDFYNCLIDGGIGTKNINKLLKWFKWTYKKIKLMNKVDIIHACNLDAALGVYRFAKKHDIKLVYDIYDYYIDSHSIPKLVENLVESLEIRVINLSDATIICTEERKEQISKSKPKNLTIIHNSPEVNNIDSVVCKYDYAYCGSLFDQRLLKEIFCEYPRHNNLSFAIAGYGEYETFVKQLDSNYEYFKYYGSVTYDKVLCIENMSKVISAIYKPTIRNHRLCAPNKFYEALALAKPVIVCKGTGIDRIIEKYNAGIVIEYSAEEFYKALEFLINNPQICEEMGKNARQLYENNYKWSIMKKRLVQLYKKLDNSQNGVD